MIEDSVRRRAAVVGRRLIRIAAAAAAGDGGDRGITEGDAAQPVVLSIGDEDSEGTIGRQGLRAVELGLNGNAAVAGETGGSRAGKGTDQAGRAVDPADDVVARVGDDQIGRA